MAMNIRAINAERMGQSNKLVILEVIRRNSGITRRDLAEVTGLDPSTITKITAALRERGLILERGAVESDQPGRKSIKLSVAGDAAVAVVAEVGVEETRLGFGYLDNTLRICREFQMPGNSGDFFDLFCRHLSELLAEVDGDRPPFALSVALPGMVDRDMKVLVDLPHAGWRNVHFVEKVLKRLPRFSLDVYMANEAKLSLMAEMFFNGELSEYHSGGYIYLSQGVGGALLIGDRIFQGASNAAGELGHMCIDPDGPRCHCGRRGCLESFISIDRVTEYCGFSTISQEESYRSKFEKLLALYEAGNPTAKAALKKMARYLSTGIANLVNVFDPGFIMLGGVGSLFPDDLVRRVEDDVRMKVLYSARKNLNVMRSSMDISRSSLLGANLLAMENFSRKAVL